MKKYGIFLTVLVLTLSLFTGCGCTAKKMPAATVPTRATTPTTPATVMPTIPATETVPETTRPMDETGADDSTGESGASEGSQDMTPNNNTKARSRMR